MRNLNSKKIQWLVLILPLLLLAYLGWDFRWVSDDGYITLRTARNLLDGYGPVFNPGERVEAFTSPLWMYLNAAIGLIGIDLPISAVFLGMIGSLTGLCAAFFGASKLWKQNDCTTGYALDVPLGGLIWVSLPPVWIFVTSGFETGLIWFWIGVSFWSAIHLQERILSETNLTYYDSFTIIFLGLGPLVRPELSLYTIGLLGLFSYRKFLNGTFLDTFTTVILPLSLPAIGYQIFRMGYYATPVPNTALTKEASASYWNHGWKYIVDFILPYHLWIPLILIFLLFIKKISNEEVKSKFLPVLFVYFYGSLLYGIYVVRLGGGFMHARLLLPPLFGLLLPIMSCPITLIINKAHCNLTEVSYVFFIVTWCLFSGMYFRVPYSGTVGYYGIESPKFHLSMAKNEHPVYPNDYGTHHMVNKGRGLRDFSLFIEKKGLSPQLLLRGEDEPSITDLDSIDSALKHSFQTNPEKIGSRINLVANHINIGLLSYVAGSSVHVVDPLGLSDPISARIKLERRKRPGHEKWLSWEWMYARFAIDLDSEIPTTKKLYAAREVLKCSPVKDLIEAITQPLSPGRFFKNMLLSMRFYSLRIPSDPVNAEKKFCDTSSSP